MTAGRVAKQQTVSLLLGRWKPQAWHFASSRCGSYSANPALDRRSTEKAAAGRVEKEGPAAIVSMRRSGGSNSAGANRAGRLPEAGGTDSVSLSVAQVALLATHRMENRDESEKESGEVPQSWYTVLAKATKRRCLFWGILLPKITSPPCSLFGCWAGCCVWHNAKSRKAWLFAIVQGPSVAIHRAQFGGRYSVLAGRCLDLVQAGKRRYGFLLGGCSGLVHVV